MTPCREWTGANTGKRRPYGVRRINGVKVLVHRWTWEQVNGPIPEGLEMMHLCDNPACYRLDHLRVGTHTDNMQDRKIKGRYTGEEERGEGNPRAKLTNEQVKEIFASTESGETLASRYGVTRQMIGYIRRGANWSHITGGK